MSKKPKSELFAVVKQDLRFYVDQKRLKPFLEQYGKGLNLAGQITKRFLLFPELKDTLGESVIKIVKCLDKKQTVKGYDKCGCGKEILCLNYTRHAPSCSWLKERFALVSKLGLPTVVTAYGASWYAKYSEEVVKEVKLLVSEKNLISQEIGFTHFNNFSI